MGTASVVGGNGAGAKDGRGGVDARDGNVASREISRFASIRGLDDLQERGRTQYVSSFGIGLIHDALGERDAALAALERAYDEHALEFSQWKLYPAFQAVQAEPRYQVVLRHVAPNP